MPKLVICEKPAAAKSIAAVLSADQRENGFFSGNDWLVSWCVGHLAGLADAAAYDSRYEKWRKEDLPILPEQWKYVIRTDKKSRFDILDTLMHRNDVTEVVNACDAGREGELIFRTVYALSKCTKPVKRLWISSMEDSAIRDGFEHLEPGSKYDGLHQAALCRMKADWLVGINATRLFSVLYGRTLNIGRVVSPTLALVVQREAAISAFQATPFYHVELHSGNLTLSSEKIADKKEAESIADACQNSAITITTVEQREKSDKAPALYDLTTLQREANRQLGFTAQQTLDYLQALYEKKLCTYPRTDSRFLTDDMESLVQPLAEMIAEKSDLNAPETVLAGQVCNSKKVSDHHAVIPTKSITKEAINALPIGERKILQLVSLAFLRAVSTPYRYAETVSAAVCGTHTFHAKGRTVLDPGWRVYGDESKDTVLPHLEKGMILSADTVTLKEGKTAPPKHHTEDTILLSMEMAGANDMPEDAERKGIGTPATRAAILEKLISSGLVERRKAQKITNLIPTQAGNSLITVLPEALQSPLLTAEWEQRLAQVERDELEPSAFMDGIVALVTDLVRTYQRVPGAETLFPSGREAVGPCPRCGGIVSENKQGFFCENPDCKFALWKNSRFFSAKKKTLTKAIAATLLKDGKVKLKGCYSEKTGKTYNAVVTLADDGEKVNYKMVFDND